LTIIQRQVRTFLIARKNGTVISETKDNLNIITQQLSSAKSQLMQSEKMASLGQLAAGIAHEINNPVGYIRSNLEVLSSHIQDISAFMAATKAFIAEQKLINDEHYMGLVKEYDMEYIIEDTDDIVTSNIEGVDRISEIVNGLKTFSHQGETDFSALPIGQIVSAALNVVKNEVKYKHDVQHILNEQDIYIFGKLGQLQQVFVNIFVNAAQAMPGGGSIKIEYVLGGKSCQILVSDTGSGMSSTTQKQLFDPFYTTKPVGEGTGLGLSISYSIIESHKGTIEVESTEGVGTTFIITLPLASKVLG
jgi:signal transduction histidine kinase